MPAGIAQQMHNGPTRRSGSSRATVPLGRRLEHRRSQAAAAQVANLDVSGLADEFAEGCAARVAHQNDGVPCGHLAGVSGRLLAVARVDGLAAVVTEQRLNAFRVLLV